MFSLAHYSNRTSSHTPQRLPHRAACVRDQARWDVSLTSIRLFRDFILDQLWQLCKLTCDLVIHLSANQGLEQPRKTIHGQLPCPAQTSSSTLWFKYPCTQPAGTRLTSNHKAAVGVQFCDLREHFCLSSSQVA